MKQLILFRHAKTEPYAETGTDESRKLTDRGHSDAQIIASQLKALKVEPSYALVSSARRTRETFSELQRLYPGLKYSFSEDLYLATPEEIIASIEKIADTDALIVIGHNPGLHELALQLTEMGGFRNSYAANQIRIKFPTAAVALFTAKEDDPFNAYNFELEDFFTPKSLAGADL